MAAFRRRAARPVGPGRAGFLQNSGLNFGQAMFNTTYWWRGGITKAQQGGLLGLCEVIGPGLIIESYKAVTAPIARPGVAGIGLGLVLGPFHILTNKHVITDMQIKAGDELVTPKTPRPPVITTPGHEIPDTVRVARTVTHQELDVGVLELQNDEDHSGLNVLA